MIISRTPLRVSFFGGGTDLPQWFMNNGGAVISTTINKYCYISCKLLPSFLDYKYRIVYTNLELVKEMKAIQHPGVRETFNFMRQIEPTEVIHSGDLPSRAGLGSSSAFVVGLLHALYAMKGKTIDKKDLGSQAIFIEQQLIREAVGNQDQIATAHGGFNFIEFDKDGFEIRVFENKDFLEEFNKHLLLFFTGETRNSFEIEQSKIDVMADKISSYHSLMELTAEALKEMTNPTDLNKIGKLLNQEWLIKKELSNKVSGKGIDEIHSTALNAGAIGGKLLGSGGCGFMLFFVEPDKQEAVKEALKKLVNIPFKFETNGSEILYRNGDI